MASNDITDTTESLEYNKSTWGEGPWQHEPDRVEWVHSGYACLITRNEAGGYLCGYVAVGPSHPFFGMRLSDPALAVARLDAHGGVNYAHPCSGKVCHTAKPGMPEHVWWFGFDCAHGCDVQPALGALFKTLGITPRGLCADHGKYRDLLYVTHCVEHLADQLRDIENGSNVD